MSQTVHVTGISSQTSEKEVHDFFSFCGKIHSLSVTSESSASQSATVTFEKETAAKTALLLDNTELGSSQVHVTAGKSSDHASSSKSAGASEDDLAQEDKPRARVAAEMLAHGYNLSDQVIQKALALDQQHGISSRFTSALQNFDAKYKVSEKAQATDEQYGISAKANEAWKGLNSYFEKAVGTPTGQKVRQFYEQGSRQVLDVHNEAKHLASLKTGKEPNHPVEGKPGRTACGCRAVPGKCSCKAGECACSSCSKNPDEKIKVSAEEAELRKVPGTENTKCNCKGADEKCACVPGNCACSNCSRNPNENVDKVSAEEAGLHKVPGTEKTKCNCGGSNDKCACVPGNCACSNCSRNPSEKVNKVTAEEAELKKIPGTETTKCNCGGADEKCACEPGNCACSNCSRNPSVKKNKVTAEEAGLHKVPGTEKTKCNCGGVDEKCACDPGNCACADCPRSS